MYAVDFHQFSESLVRAIEAKDIYTAGHSDRVALLTGELARFMNLPEEKIAYYHIAGHVHDIGKIGIPDGILLKSGRLTNKEYELMQEHSEMGWRILQGINGLEEMSTMVRHHHERYDGKGYPDGLKGEAIPEGAAVIGVADAFDAMTTTRSYRVSISISEACRRIKDDRGAQFHPRVVDAFLRLIKDGSGFLEEYFARDAVSERKRQFMSFNSIKET